MNEAPVHEQALVFACAGEHLVGVLALPPQGVASAATPAPLAGPPRHGVVIIVGGPQYRAGSHRYFTRLARRLAAAGHASLRFDLRGMGDSTGSPLGFEHAGPDIRAAVDALQRAVPALPGVVLWGLCDAASAALMYPHGYPHGHSHAPSHAPSQGQAQDPPDPRIAGRCLLNPWVRSEASLAQTHLRHWYGRRLLQPAFWRKLLRGGVGRSALRGWWTDWQQARAGRAAARPPDAAFQQRMLRGLQHHGGPTLIHLADSDPTALEFAEVARTDPAWRAALGRADVTLRHIAQADHTVSSPESQAVLEADTLAWLAALDARPRARAA